MGQNHGLHPVPELQLGQDARPATWAAGSRTAAALRAE
jgi:hypothetical protein